MTDVTNETESDIRQPDPDLLMLAWGLLANVSEGDWSKQTPEWQEAMLRWRDEFHAWLDAAFDEKPADG